MFAPSHQLGFDPTVRLVDVGEENSRYDIVVRSASGEISTYRTIKLLSRPISRTVMGRATRVWEAVRIVDEQGVNAPGLIKYEASKTLAERGELPEQVR